MKKTDTQDPTKLLFCPSYFYRFDKKQWEDNRPYPPYGTLYAAAVMRKEGYNVSFFDTHLRKNTQEIIPVLAFEKPNYLVIYDDGFNYLTKMCLTAMRSAAFEMIQFAKKENAIVIVCNSDATDHFEKYLDNGADYIVFGEGEITLQELIADLESPKPNPSAIKGIAYKDATGIVVNQKRPVLHDLDSLPDPAWDLIDLQGYQDIWKNNHGYFSLNIATTRGCPFKCNWCAKPIYGNRYNSRSPERVAQELNYLNRQFGASHFWIADDIFGLKPKWVQEFRTEVQRLDLKIKYKIQSRADLLLQPDYIDDLVTSGLDMAWIGAESGSQKILDAMDKGITVAQIGEARNLLKSKKVNVGFFLQFGYLGENLADIAATIEMVQKLNPDDIGISVSYPLPGTLFYEKVKDQLKSKQNWVNSDDLDMMYEGAFSPQFYKRLHRYVHKVFRLGQGLNHLKNLFRKPRSINANGLKSIASVGYYLPASWIDRLKLKFLSTS